jgi:hypothetical protein
MAFLLNECGISSMQGSPMFLPNRFYNEIDHEGRRGDEGSMVDRTRAHPRLHAIGHKSLRRLSDHAVLLGEQIPARAILPEGPVNGGTDADRRDRSLHGGKPCVFLMGGVLGKGRGKRI